jgi:hypothetical protein
MRAPIIQPEYPSFEEFLQIQGMEPNPDSPSAERQGSIVEINTGDAVIQIDFNPDDNPEQTRKRKEAQHDDNLAELVDEAELGRLAQTLLTDIRADDQSRADWLENYTRGLELLGNKIDQPSTGTQASGGTFSKVRHPLLLEACIRFQANARGELLPAGGPVKIRNDGPSNKVVDEAAQALETDFNHYLTVTASEYYPNTDKMLFQVGFGGMGFKKVYYHPIYRRPVSESVPVEDIIVNNAEDSLDSCGRITQRIQMRPSMLRRMQLLGVYRDVPLTSPSTVSSSTNSVKQEIEDQQGVRPHTEQDPEHNTRTMYECYCELDLEGFEHEVDGEPSGLLLPYRVVIDEDSETILEIRRWWEEDDEMYMRKEVFVEYKFLPAFGFYAWGLKDLLGNTAMALTAGLRMTADAGAFANFPGFLTTKDVGRNTTNNMSIPPGGSVAIETNGRPIGEVAMPLPYKGVDAGFVSVLQALAATGERLGGTAELNVGEGVANVPVGSVIAMIEQATMSMSAVHKRLHAAQAKEFRLLAELFKKYPTAFWASNRAPNNRWSEDSLIIALNTNTLVPTADPNTASQAARVQKALAIKQLQAANPELYDAKAVDERILSMIGIDDYQSLFNQDTSANQGDPTKMVEAQAKIKMAEAKQAEVGIKLQDSNVDAENRRADRESRERIAAVNFAKDLGEHPDMYEQEMEIVRPILPFLQQDDMPHIPTTPRPQPPTDPLANLPI